MQPPKLSADLALFLDFDGVLVEIAPMPDAVVVREGLIETLEAVQAHLDGALALVSGRMLDDVTSKLTPFSSAASGSHGLEKRLVDGTLEVPSDAVKEAATLIAAELRAAMGEQPGLVFEEKTWSVSLHFRAAPQLQGRSEDVMRDVLSHYPGWEMINGKMVVEGRLAGTSKGDAVTHFMQHQPFKGRTPVFIGDDVTDEDGMRAAIAAGGFGIKVGEGETVSQYRLEDPEAVFNWLQNLQI